MFVCPSDKVGGQAPTNCLPGNQGVGVPDGALPGGYPGQDNQAPRLSYGVNEQLMPRPRGGVAETTFAGDTPQPVVPISDIDAPASTIMIFEFTDYLNALSGGGPGGVKFKSHRPANVLSTAAGSDGLNPYDTSKAMTAANYYTIDKAGMAAVFAAAPKVPFGDATYNHLIYTNAGRHSGGVNYDFADGHSKWYKPEQTINCNSFLWGKKIYSNALKQDVLCAETGNVGTKVQ